MQDTLQCCRIYAYHHKADSSGVFSVSLALHKSPAESRKCKLDHATSVHTRIKIESSDFMLDYPVFRLNNRGHAMRQTRAAPQNSMDVAGSSERSME